MVGASEQGGHALVVVDDEKRILAQRFRVPPSELSMRLQELRVAHGAGARILLDGEAVPETIAAQQVAKGEPRAFEIAAVELAHHMLWSSYERAAQVQAWMLERANGFTRDLLDNNRRLADQASELQERFQANLAKLDAVQFEHKMMEEEASTRRLSRHIVLQTRAEIEAEKPRDNSWMRDAVEVALMWMMQAQGGQERRRNG